MSEQNPARRILSGTAMLAVAAVALIITATNWKLSQTNDSIVELRRNHEASICLMSVIHEISAASGKPKEQAAGDYQEIFTEQWLTTNCGLTHDEALHVLAGS